MTEPSSPSDEASDDESTREPTRAKQGGGGGGGRGVQSPNADELWVQCDKCKKWRRLPSHVDASNLPSKWYCQMNGFDTGRNSCKAPEQDYSGSSGAAVKVSGGKKLTVSGQREKLIRSHIGMWVRRVKSSEKAEARLPSSMSTRGKRKQPEKEARKWVQCSLCGKWRSVINGIQFRADSDGQFYCAMSTWDEALASCGAPQETGLTMKALFGGGRHVQRKKSHAEH
jgi:hypothetical protein